MRASIRDHVRMDEAKRRTMDHGLLVCIDIGNTNITAGVFDGGRLVASTKIPTYYRASYAEHFRLLTGGRIPKDGTSCSAIISSVVPDITSSVETTVREQLGCNATVTGRDVIVPIRNLYRNKDEVGQDRLVNAFATLRIYGSPAIVIDFGTAVTFDIVSRGGAYLGGLILPGIEMSLSSLCEKTALLPKVDLEEVYDIIGKDTIASIRSGLLFGLGTMCDGLIAKYRRILGKGAKAIATGGNAGLVKKYSRSIQTVDTDLTLKGLALIIKNI